MYCRSILPVVEAQIAACKFSLQDLVGRLNVKILSESELNRYPEWRKIFLNVNTPEELERAHRLAP